MFGNASITNLGLAELILHKIEIHIIASSSVTKSVFFPSLIFQFPWINLPQEL